MKKLTASVLIVVLSSTFTMMNAQESPKDTIKTQNIEGVLITGAMGIKRTADAQTSAAQVVNAEKINQASNPNAIQALSGKVSGLTVNLTNSSVGGTSSIRLRGARSITGNNEALIVIDNVISTAAVLEQLPPEVIESVSVLKGAQGAALYGADGVNGAIIVTTKKGNKAGRFNVTYNTAIDFETVAYLPKRQRQYGQGWDGDKINVENGAWGPAFNDPAWSGTTQPYGIPLYDLNGDGIISMNPNDSGSMPDDGAAIQSVFAPYGKDNVRDFFKVGSIFQNTLTANVGGENSYLLMAIGNVYRNFVVDEDKLNRTSFLFKGGVKYNRWSFDGSVNYINQKISETNSGLYHDVLQSSSDIPIERFRNVQDVAYAWNMYYTNPYWTIKHERYDTYRNFFNIMANVGFNVNEHINIKYNGSLQTTNTEGYSHNDGWSEPVLYDDFLTSIGSFYNQSKVNSWNYYGDIFADFDYNLTPDLGMKFLVGVNYQEKKRSANSAGGTGIIQPGIYAVWNVANPTIPFNLDNDRNRINGYAVFANLDLDYKKYLFLTATARNEWWSNLNEENRSYFYNSLGLSFIPTKAFESIKGDVLNYLKVNLAWQKTANASAVKAYEIYDRAVLGYGYPYSGGVLSFVPNTTPTYYNIKPEKVNKLEAGATFGFLKDRITLSASVFKENTRDLITQGSASTASGIVNALMNLGELENKGVEIDLGVTPIKSRNFSWDLNVSFYKSKPMVIKVTDEADQVRIGGNTQVGVFAVKGEEFGTLMGTAYLRDPQGRIIIDENTGNPLYSTEFQKLGKTNPDYVLGLNTNIKIFRFELGAVMDYRNGNSFWSGTKNSMAFQGNLVESAGFDRNQGGYVIPNSVYIDGSGNYVPNTSIKSGGDSYAELTAYYGNVYSRIAENYIISGEMFKVRELSLSYNFTQDVIRNAGLTGLKVGLHARNPFVKLAKDNLNYNDPETSFTNGNAQGLINDNQYPNLRTFGMSVDIKF